MVGSITSSKLPGSRPEAPTPDPAPTPPEAPQVQLRAVWRNEVAKAMLALAESDCYEPDPCFLGVENAPLVLVPRWAEGEIIIECLKGGFQSETIKEAIARHLLAGRLESLAGPATRYAATYLMQEWKGQQSRINQQRQEPMAGLTQEEMAILEALAEKYPMMMTREDLISPTQLTEKTLTKYLTFLREKGLVHQPSGTKKGHTLTDAGRSVVPHAP